MFSLILSPSLNSFQFFLLDLRCLFHSLRQMPMPFYPLNFRHMLISLLESFIILQLLALTSRFYSLSAGGISTPKSHIAIIRPSYYKS